MDEHTVIAIHDRTMRLLSQGGRSVRRENSKNSRGFFTDGQCSYCGWCYERHYIFGVTECPCCGAPLTSVPRW